LRSQLLRQASGGKHASTAKIANTAAALRVLAVKLARCGGDLRFCYEAGPCGYGIQRQLSAAGHGIRRGSFHSVVDLQAAINRYLAEHNAEPKPFVWTASAASILGKLDRLPEPSV
jgi:hypothetical protein